MGSKQSDDNFMASETDENSLFRPFDSVNTVSGAIKEENNLESLREDTEENDGPLGVDLSGLYTLKMKNFEPGFP